MATNYYKPAAGLSALLLVILMVSSFSCGDDDTLYMSKKFDLPVEVTPKKDKFKVGDTLNIELNHYGSEVHRLG